MSPPLSFLQEVPQETIPVTAKTSPTGAEEQMLKAFGAKSITRILGTEFYQVWTEKGLCGIVNSKLQPVVPIRYYVAYLMGEELAAWSIDLRMLYKFSKDGALLGSRRF